MGKFPISMVIFNSYVSHYQRVYPIKSPLNPIKTPFSHGFPMVFPDSIFFPGISGFCQTSAATQESMPMIINVISLVEIAKHKTIGKWWFNGIFHGI